MHKLIAAIFLGCLDVGFAQVTWTILSEDTNYNKIMMAIHGPHNSEATCSVAANNFIPPVLNSSVDLTSCKLMFRGCSFSDSKLKNFAENLITKYVVHFNYAFSRITNANHLDLSHWNVNSATYMYNMFEGASSFNSNLSNWNVESVTDFDRMFKDATSFNSSLSNWDVTSGIYFFSMFEGATSFNSSLSNWDVSSGKEFDSMFENASSFTSNLTIWDVSSGIDFDSMFMGATSFNSDLSIWDVSSGLDFHSMFYNAISFNADLSAWYPKLISSATTDNMHNSKDVLLPHFAKTCWYDFDNQTSKDPLHTDCFCNVNEYVLDKVCTSCETSYTNKAGDNPFSTDTACDAPSFMPAKDYDVCNNVDLRHEMFFTCADKNSEDHFLQDESNSPNCEEYLPRFTFASQAKINDLYTPVNLTWGDNCFGIVQCKSHNQTSDSYDVVSSMLRCTAIPRVIGLLLQDAIATGDTHFNVSSTENSNPTKNIFVGDSIVLQIDPFEQEFKKIVNINNVTNTITVNSAFKYSYPKNYPCTTEAFFPPPTSAAKKKSNPWIIVGASLGSLAVIAGLVYGAKQYKMFAPCTKINSNAGFETLLKL